MEDTTAWSLALAGLVALGVAAALLASLLRRAGAPGGAMGVAIAGGIMAGVLLGPSVLGRTAPGIILPAFTGAAQEARTLQELVAEHRRELSALTASGVSPAAMIEMQQTHDAERLLAEEALELAQQRHAQRWSLLTAVCVGGYLFAATLLVTPARNSRWRRLAGTLVMTSARPLLGGWLAFAIAGLPAGALALLVLKWPWTSCVALAAVFAAPGLSARLAPTPYLVAAGGLFATFVSTTIVGWNIGFTIAVAGVFLGLLATLGTSFSHLRLVRSLLRPVAVGVVLALLSALAFVRLDLHHLDEPAVFWLALAIGVLWSSDGRWLASRLALLLSRSRAARLTHPWTHAAMIVDAGSSAVQVCTALVLHGAGLLPVEAVGGAVIGAAVLEFTRDIRAYVAHRLDAH